MPTVGESRIRSTKYLVTWVYYALLVHCMRQLLYTTTAVYQTRGISDILHQSSSAILRYRDLVTFVY